MEGQVARTNSNCEIDDNAFDSFQITTSTFLHSHPALHNLSSPIPIENSSLHLEEPLSSDPEYLVRYDIYGNSITRGHLSSPVPKSNRMRTEYSAGVFLRPESPNDEMDMVDYESSEWDIEKENIDPNGVLTTPYKSRKVPHGNASTNSLTGLSTSGRSPLRDITPPIGKRKAVVHWSGIERILHYTLGTPKPNNNVSGNKSVSSIKTMR